MACREPTLSKPEAICQRVYHLLLNGHWNISFSGNLNITFNCQILPLLYSNLVASPINFPKKNRILKKVSKQKHKKNATHSVNKILHIPPAPRARFSARPLCFSVSRPGRTEKCRNPTVLEMQIWSLICTVRSTVWQYEIVILYIYSNLWQWTASRLLLGMFRIIAKWIHIPNPPKALVQAIQGIGKPRKKGCKQKEQTIASIPSLCILLHWMLLFLKIACIWRH